MTDEDNKKIEVAKKKYAEATTDAERSAAHAEAEAIRANYGYSGGTDGSKNIALNNGSWISNKANTSPLNTSKQMGTSTDYGTYEKDLNNLKEAQKKYQIQQLKNARDTALNNLNVQEQNIKPTYQNARNMTSASSQQGARSFAEYLANRGLQNSGASAQGEMNRLSNLQNDLGNINTAEANAYRDIANQRTLVENNYANGMASANAQIEADYLNNLLNYNEQQRQMREQLLQNSVKQYADDYQARLNQLKAEGKEGTLEYAMTEAARGNKVENNNVNAYNYPVSMSKIQSGNWNYNDLLATGMTEQQAQQTYQDYQAILQAEAEKQALENYIKMTQLNNATALNNSNIAKNNATIANINSQISNRTNGNSEINAYTQNVKDIEKRIDSMTFNNDDELRNFIDSYAGILTQDEYTRLYLDYQL